MDSAMIMAAGLGTRLRPYTDQIPKPFIPILGIPAVQFVVDALADAGVKNCALNSHHLHQQTLTRMQQLDWHSIRVRLSDESHKLLGSGGGIVTAARKLNAERFFLANADVLYDLNWQNLARRHRDLRQRHGVRLTLALTRRPHLGGKYREIQVQESGQLASGLGVSTELGWFYAGAAVIEQDALAGLEPETPYEFVPAILEPALRAGQVGVCFQEALWLDVGSPELWAQTHFALMHALENGFDLPQSLGRSFALWRARIESVNRRYAPGIWSDRRTHLRCGADWSGPIYCAGKVDSAGILGPRWISYGASLATDARMTEARPSRDAIVWNGYRTDLDPNAQGDRQF